jgi:hypothetical protein
MTVYASICGCFSYCKVEGDPGASYISSQFSHYHRHSSARAVRMQHLTHPFLRSCGKQRSTHDGICIDLWVGMIN